MSDNPNWWSLDNHLLVHALNINGRTKGDYEKDLNKPLPSVGEVSCSIVSPLTQGAYGSSGVVLAPTTPTRVSYADVGTFYPKGVDVSKESRTARGKMWSSDEMSMEQLAYLTLACSSYNEVLVNAAETRIIGVFGGWDENIEEFVQGKAEVLRSGDPEKYEIPHCTLMANALLQADFYIHKKRAVDTWSGCWEMQDLLGEHRKKYEHPQYFADAVVAGDVTVDKLLEGIDRTKVFGGSFIRQQITSEHKAYLSEALASSVSES